MGGAFRLQGVLLASRSIDYYIETKSENTQTKNAIAYAYRKTTLPAISRLYYNTQKD